MIRTVTYLLSLALLCVGSFSSCDKYLGDDWAIHDRSDEKAEADMLRDLSVLLYAAAQPGIVWHDCRLTASLPRNPVYATYWLGFVNDNMLRPTPLVSVRGDSTQDLANAIDGHFSVHTSNRAVSGNTACDKIEQLPSAPQRTQTAILISTYGGNDLLSGLTPAEAAHNVIDLFDQTRATWPDAKIVGLGTHPVRIASLAASGQICGAGGVNTLVRAHLATMTNVCDVDPYPLYGKTCGQMADESQLLPNDLIHPNEALTGAGKQAIKAQCGVEL